VRLKWRGEMCGVGDGKTTRNSGSVERLRRSEVKTMVRNLEDKRGKFEEEENYKNLRF
jgi:hypothetical protein